MKISLTTTIIASCLVITACGSDSNSSANNEAKNFSGYVPKFSTAYLNASPQNTAAISTNTTATSSMTSNSALALQASENSSNDDTETEAEIAIITIAPINCQETIEAFNAAPQANDFSNSALDFIRNLQAQTNSSDCIMRKQVLEHPATITAENELTTITSSFINDDYDNYTIWQIPTEHHNKSNDTELNINARGTLLNVQRGDSNTRIDLVQRVDDEQLLTKIIRTTLLTPSTTTTNIRTALVIELRDENGQLITQRMGGRITFDNKISVVAAAIAPNIGAISYIKQCDESTAANSNDYMRACTQPWQALAYDKDWGLLTDASEIANLLTLLSLNTEGSSVMDEITFFFGEPEDDFFTDKELPSVQ